MELAVDILRNLLQTGLILSIPILGTATVVGLVVSFIQSITSLQEQTLTFVPKLICVSIGDCVGRQFYSQDADGVLHIHDQHDPHNGSVTIFAEEIVVWVLVFLRTGAFFLGIPLFAGKMIPKKIRTAFALMFSLLINPLVPADLELANHFAGAILLALNEMCIGLLLAMTVRMVFFAVELAGHLISYEIGLMASNSVNPLLGSSDATITTLLYYFSLLLFFVAGVHYGVLKAFYYEFRAFADRSILS